MADKVVAESLSEQLDLFIADVILSVENSREEIRQSREKISKMITKRVICN